jgi:hypothetical protein
MKPTFNQWLQIAGHPYNEKRGERTAVCTEGLLINVAAQLSDLEDYRVWAVCGPFTEIVAYQPKTGAKCHCRPGIQRDNCQRCEGTGQVIDFAKIRAR